MTAQTQKQQTGEGNAPRAYPDNVILIEEFYPESGQWRLSIGSRVVIATESNGRYHSRLYVNKGETATTTAASHATRAGVKLWATKVLTP